MKKIEVIGLGEECPKCGQLMERRKHRERPDKTWFYEKWDYCRTCKHIQHYDKFKSDIWKETERQEDFLRNIL